MPALAKDDSRAGAKAFVRYYVDIINFSWAADSTRRLRQLSDSSCQGCRAAADGIDEVTTAGGYRRGTNWTSREIFLVPLQPASAPIANVAVHVSRGVFKESKREAAQEIEPGIRRFDFHLEWRGGTWLVHKLVVA